MAQPSNLAILNPKNCQSIRDTVSHSDSFRGLCLSHTLNHSPIRIRRTENSLLCNMAWRVADYLATLAATAEVPEDEVAGEGDIIDGLVALVGRVWLTELEPETLATEEDEVDCAVVVEVLDSLFAEAVSVKLVTASCMLKLAAFGAGDEMAGLFGVGLGSLGGVGSSEPSMCLYQLLFESSRQSPTVTALNPFELIDLSIISVILFTVSDEVSWPITSMLSEVGSDLAVRLPEKSFIDA